MEYSIYIDKEVLNVCLAHIEKDDVCLKFDTLEPTKINICSDEGSVIVEQPSLVLSNPSKTFAVNSSEDSKRQVVLIIANYLDVDYDSFWDTTEREFAYRKHLAFYFFRFYLQLTLKEISTFFRKKDHTTISRATDALISKMDKKDYIRKDINMILTIIEETLPRLKNKPTNEKRTISGNNGVVA